MTPTANTPAPRPETLLPGATIGILGGGQLGRMMALAAKQMGYRVHVLTDTADSPAGQVADREVVAALDDLPAVEAFARDLQVATVETENIPLAALQHTGRFAPAFPGGRALQVSQNRSHEKSFLVEHRIGTSPYTLICSQQQLETASRDLLPAILKTTTGGYDGKGQCVLRAPSDIAGAWQTLGAEEAILESWVNYDCEFSVIAARQANGVFTAYSPIRNQHRNQILDVSLSPSGLPAESCREAIDIARQILEGLDAVGVMTVEFFYAAGQVLVNEIAPRPHNSGHLTIEAHQTSQFEQHIRAICGLPFGSTQQIQPAAMANLLGDCWQLGEPDWRAALAIPGTKLHLYGKSEPRLKRKMGHLTALADSIEAAQDNVLAARQLITGVPPRNEPRNPGQVNPANHVDLVAKKP